MGPAGMASLILQTVPPLPTDLNSETSRRLKPNLNEQRYVLAYKQSRSSGAGNGLVSLSVLIRSLMHGREGSYGSNTADRKWLTHLPPTQGLCKAVNSGFALT